jgi:hypothetical protein
LLAVDFFAGFEAVFFAAGLRAAACFLAGARFFMPRNLHERSCAVKHAERVCWRYVSWPPSGHREMTALAAPRILSIPIDTRHFLTLLRADT